MMYIMKLNNDDPLKFSKSTPKWLSSSRYHIWEGIPSSTRIVQDMKRVIYENIPTTRDNQGIIY